jgi:hypothetical protein
MAQAHPLAVAQHMVGGIPTAGQPHRAVLDQQPPGGARRQPQRGVDAQLAAGGTQHLLGRCHGLMMDSHEGLQPLLPGQARADGCYPRCPPGPRPMPPGPGIDAIAS